MAMKCSVTCPKCQSIVEYDNTSIWEGNRDFEDILCPVCGTLLGKVFTDLNPTVRLVKKGKVLIRTDMNNK